jgi:hypothetical protein
MPYRIIDEMPTQGEVEAADPQQIVRWQMFLRPTMMNDELHIVKAIAARYDRLPAETRESLGAQLRREHTL